MDVSVDEFNISATRHQESVISDRVISGIPLNVISSGPVEPPPPWITGFVQTPIGNVSRAATTWDDLDRRGQIRARVSNRFRMNYLVKPGLLAVGNPTPDSPVLLSANYKLSFDILRRELDGIDAWILVLDTMTDRNLCIECGACQNNCEDGAISVTAGVGCAEAIIYGMITGNEPQCGCSTDDAGGSECC